VVSVRDNQADGMQSACSAWSGRGWLRIRRRARTADPARRLVTFRSCHQTLAMVVVDRFVDRAIFANSAIRAIGGTAPWYPCRQRVRSAGPCFS